MSDITRIQSATGSGTASTSCVVTLGGSPTNGNFLVIVIGTTSIAADPVSSIAQTGATWAKAISVDTSLGSSMDIWYAMNVSGAGTTITVTLAGVLTSAAVAGEWDSGVLTSLLDKTASQVGDENSVANTGTTALTSQPNELCIGGIALAIAGGTWNTPSDGFVNVDSINNVVYVVMEEKIVSSPGAAFTSNSTSVLATPNRWAGAMATFKDINPGGRRMVIS